MIAITIYSWSITGKLEKTLFEQMCMIQRLWGLISSCDRLGHRLQPLADRLWHYLDPTVKGTVFEDLVSTDTQQNAFWGEECWLKEDILECLKDHFHIGRAFHNSNIMPAKARQYNQFIYCRVIFSPSSFSIRDSHVAIGNQMPDGMWERSSRYPL